MPRTVRCRTHSHSTVLNPGMSFIWGGGDSREERGARQGRERVILQLKCDEAQIGIILPATMFNYV